MMRDTHSSTKILATIVTLFVVLVGATGIVVAAHTPPSLSVSLGKPGVERAPAAHITYKGKDGKNALELLKSHVAVTTQQSSYGEYINTIDGVKSGQDGKYWALYVNGKQVPIAAGNVTTHNSDSIEWKLE
jgi:hypothetical protein